ncbi:MAG: hypothetical protein QOD61_2276 [Solirubrobacteraceae bacterium]|nr:hypothetical protein [Solirubrobacteraceae bacterium]
MPTTFVLVTLVYPVLLAGLCLGAGLLVDRAAGGFLPGALLPVVGAAGLIGASQLTTDVPSLAPATPGVIAGLAAAGFLVGWRRTLALGRTGWSGLGGAVLAVLAYLVALAPVLLAGRPTFSGYGVLPDSALHMIGADYLIRHGQEYAGLDLQNSYGQYISAYFNTSYPSGSHTLFGASARLLGVPLVWALQPFCAFILATAVGPGLVLARRVGLSGAWAGLAALTVAVPALVYGYELVASLKEMTALPLILGLGALVVVHRTWVTGPPNRAIPFALVAVAGVSALGVAFGAWALGAVVVVAAIVVGQAVAGRGGLGRSLGLAAVGVIVALVAGWPTWTDLHGSLQVAQGIAGTSNPGNLTAPLHIEQVLGSWLSGSYRHRVPMGPARTVTYVLIGVTLASTLIGAIHVVRTRAYALGAWIGLLLVLWVGLTQYGATWSDAKLLVLTSPVAVLLAWAGVAGLRASPLRLLAPILGLVIAGGIIASDVVEYHSTDLAPTARYEEMAALNTRYAGRGPVLFTDFDEWSLYVLRDLDVGGPDFIFPPVGLERVATGHGDPVDLDRIGAATFGGYPLIITRRDPRASRPPSAYGLDFEGTYYQVWARRPGAPVALAHVRLSGRRRIGCPTVRRLARVAGAHRAQLVSAAPVEVVAIDLAATRHPDWEVAHPRSVGLLMTRHGRLDATFRVPRAGVWDVWVQGEIMPRVGIGVDGRRLGSIASEVSGSVFNEDTMTPVPVALTAGTHRLTLDRGGLTPDPGDGGSAILHAVFVTRAGTAGTHEAMRVTPPARWRSLCGKRLDWLEVTSA